MHELGGMKWIDDECDAYSKDACTRAWGHVRRESPRTCVLDTCYLCLIGGAARVSERGVLVRKGYRSGVRKGLCD